MANYIDQDDLLESVEQIMYEYDDPAMALVEIISTIEDWGHPLADPEIVKHGRWVRDIGLWQCSCCKLHWAGRTRYCPACGAKLEADNG